jgi:hypothetical protein
MVAAAPAIVRAGGWQFSVFELGSRIQPNGPQLYDRLRTFFICDP